jgi:hypothetical protein
MTPTSFATSASARAAIAFGIHLSVFRALRSSCSAESRFHWISRSSWCAETFPSAAMRASSRCCFAGSEAIAIPCAVAIAPDRIRAWTSSSRPSKRRRFASHGRDRPSR